MPNPTRKFYGRQTVQEILASGMAARRLRILEGSNMRALKDILQLAKEHHVPVENISRREIEQSVHGNHQGVVLEVDDIESIDFKTFLKQLQIHPGTFVCLCDEIQDPQNLGAIIRNAAFLGCSGIILPTWRSAGLTEVVWRVSSGAASRIPIVEIANLSVAIERLKEKGFFVYAADVDGASDLRKMDWIYPVALILGNEHRGVKPILKSACDGRVAIPQVGAEGSLNVASASAIFFYELSRKK